MNPFEADFIGSWIFDPSLDSQMYREFLLSEFNTGLFYMKIEDRERRGDTEKIRGTIEDSFGNSIFEGELNQNHIEFMKTYDSVSIQRGAAREGVRYEGSFVEDHYEGQFTVINGIVKGEVKDWSMEFIMWKTSGPSMN
ncbi:MAG: hypothetical protein BV456_12660 [Thermoplasmata archaeon M8B2D]|nr:MAG: hypothetical protein BV456_12660 [Thermoplasmata archaeon M8B2D]